MAKYKKDSNGNSILGKQYGVTVTRPWSKEMYDHNDDVAATLKNNISEAVHEAYDEWLHSTEDNSKLKELSKHICYYSFGEGYTTRDIFVRTLEELAMMQNHQLHEQYKYMVKDGFVRNEEIGFVGYDKL